VFVGGGPPTNSKPTLALQVFHVNHQEFLNLALHSWGGLVCNAGAVAVLHKDYQRLQRTSVKFCKASNIYGLSLAVNNGAFACYRVDS
jgi:hypothetical protein